MRKGHSCSELQSFRIAPKSLLSREPGGLPVDLPTCHLVAGGTRRGSQESIGTIQSRRMTFRTAREPRSRTRLMTGSLR
jgi:hypothetical protein